MRIGWLPYLQIEYSFRGPKVIEVGKARFLPDNGDTWANEIKRTRPQHLDIFRSFPLTSDINQPGDPIRGTVVVCEDEEWLQRYLDEAVAIIYFLGDVPHPGRPAECFAYHHLRLKDDGGPPAELVSFATKHGEHWEGENSIVLYPPLVARGNLQGYSLETKRPEHQKLLQIFKDEPQDRLIVAVRQYFRTQFSDIFASTFHEDYATYCSSIEAALDIDTLHAAADRFVERLTGIYGADQMHADFFLGLYVSRSLYVHGGAIESATSGASKGATAYQYFSSRKSKLTTLRMLSRDVIFKALGRPEDPFGFEPQDSAKPVLRKILLSDGLWDRVKGLLNKAGAADAICARTDDEFEEIEKLAIALQADLEWTCITNVIDVKHIRRAIGTCALMLARLTSSAGPIYAVSDRLGKAADAGDAGEIQKWCIDEHEWRETWVKETDRVSAIQVIAAVLASYFDRVS